MLLKKVSSSILLFGKDYRKSTMSGCRISGNYGRELVSKPAISVKKKLRRLP